VFKKTGCRVAASEVVHQRVPDRLPPRLSTRQVVLQKVGQRLGNPHMNNRICQAEDGQQRESVFIRFERLLYSLKVALPLRFLLEQIPLGYQAVTVQGAVLSVL